MILSTPAENGLKTQYEQWALTLASAFITMKYYWNNVLQSARMFSEHLVGRMVHLVGIPEAGEILISITIPTT